MSVDDADIRKIAHLARIAVSDEDVVGLRAELNQILEWVEQLDEVDTSGVEPMTSVVAHAMERRDDRVTDGNIADDVVKNAPEAQDHYFAVPKVVE